MEHIKNNKISVKWHILSQLKNFFALDKKVIKNILDSTEYDINQKEIIMAELNKPETLFNINKIYKFLSIYNGDNLEDEFNSLFSTLLETNLSPKFYIYFMFNYYVRREGIISKNTRFKDNISSLFYDQDIEVEFNKQEFRNHYRRCYLKKENLAEPLDKKLVEEIQKEVPKTANELETAITIYILLCQKLYYSSDYIINKDETRITPYWKINSENNDVVCFTFSIVYYKLLKMYGIDANLSGDSLTHMKVELRINSMMIEADATSFGRGYDTEYKLSDLANVHFGFALTGFKLMPLSYTDYNYIKYNEKRLEECMLKVKQRICKDSRVPFVISSIIYERSLKFQTFKKNNNPDLAEQIDYIIETLNQLASFKVDNAECENKQLLAKISHKLFNGYKQYTKKVFLLFDSEGTKIHLYNLYMCEIDSDFIFYLETEEGLIKYDKKNILEEINRRNLRFKTQEDSDMLILALNRDKKKIKQKEINS